MHKGVILLTKAVSCKEAREQAEEFLANYGDGNVWDWYVIGGRWSGTLVATEKEFFKKANQFLVDTKQTKDVDFGVGYNVLENMDNQKEFQRIWKNLGNKTLNPYSRDSFLSYSNKQLKGNFDPIIEEDVRPLSECIDVVRGWCLDLTAEKGKAWADMIKAHEEKDVKGFMGTMDAYYAGIYKDLAYGEFCFESCVYDIEENVAEKVPEDIMGYFAVMVDMHN